MATVITDNKSERGFELCKCAVCDEVSTCTPFNDFYHTGKHGEDGDGILCESCFREYAMDITNKSNEKDGTA